MASVRPGAYISFIADGRFKRALLGYRRADVDAALTGLDAALAATQAELAGAIAALGQSERTSAQRAQRVQQLELVADRLSELVVAKEREHEETRGRLSAVEADLEQARLALAAAQREADEAIIEASSEHERAEEAMREALIAKVEVEASRAEARAESKEELTLGEELLAIDDADDGIDALSLVPPPPDEDDGVAEGASEEWVTQEPDSLEVEISGNGVPDGVYDGVVTVEIGPFSDFSQLVRFEDAAKSIAATAEIAVKRFSKGRATLEMRLTDPVELLAELDARTPFEFSVRTQDAGGLVLDLAA